MTGALILATSYFRTTYRCTIIGAAAFHFRVRNGNGWFHCAKVTRGPGFLGSMFCSECVTNKKWSDNFQGKPGISGDFFSSKIHENKFQKETRLKKAT